MNQYSKQFALVNRIKAIVRLTGRAIRGRNRRNEISEDIARKIQKSSYEVERSVKPEEYTPPYKAIAKQLQVRDAYIYSAAVSALTEIAKQQILYRDSIVKILTQQLKDKEIPLDLQDYIRQKLKDITARAVQ